MIFSWFLYVLNTQEGDESTVEKYSRRRLVSIFTFIQQERWNFLNDFWTLNVIIFEGQWKQNFKNTNLKYKSKIKYKIWDSDRWPLGFLSQHCIVAEGQSIHQAWEAVMELGPAGMPCVNTHDTERWLGCTKRSQMWTQDKHCKLSYCRVYQWNVATGRTHLECNPKTRGLYGSRILGIPEWRRESRGNCFVTDELIGYCCIKYYWHWVVLNGESRTIIEASYCTVMLFVCAVYCICIATPVLIRPGRKTLMLSKWIPFEKGFDLTSLHWFCGPQSSTRQIKPNTVFIQSIGSIKLCLSALTCTLFLFGSSLDSRLNVSWNTWFLLFLIWTKQAGREPTLYVFRWFSASRMFFFF